MSTRIGQADKRRTALFLLVGLLLLMTVVAAALVVVRSVRRIQPVEAPVQLQPRQPDEGLRQFRSGTRRRLHRIEQRYERYHAQVSFPTAEQESLATVISAELAGTRANLAELDSLAAFRSQRELERYRSTVFERYRQLVNTVSRYVRTVLAREGPELDSLDRELELLLRDVFGPEG
ncbi:MAG: hypothetical protein R6X14_01435 [bacterium]